MGRNTQKHAAMSEDDRQTIEQDITLMENSFNTLARKTKEKLKRYNSMCVRLIQLDAFSWLSRLGL